MRSLGSTISSCTKTKIQSLEMTKNIFVMFSLQLNEQDKYMLNGK